MSDSDDETFEDVQQELLELNRRAEKLKKEQDDASKRLLECLREECKEVDPSKEDTGRVAELITEFLRVTGRRPEDFHLADSGVDMFGWKSCEKNPFRFAIPPTTKNIDADSIVALLDTLFSARGFKWSYHYFEGTTFIYANLDGRPEFRY